METQTGSEMETQSQIKGITKDTTISDVLMQNPDQASLLSDIMMDFGIHCVGCGAASFETLEQGVLGHGFSEDKLSTLIVDLNKVIKENGSKPKEEEKGEFKLNLTDAALNKIKDVMSKREGETTLRVSVLAGGCSGFTYNLDFVDSPREDDVKFEQGGVKMAVEKETVDLITGTRIDYVDTLNDSGFKFDNPNAQSQCGCGSSFG